MQDGVQNTPLSLHTCITLHLYLSFAPLDTISLITGNEVGKEKCVGTLGTVLGKDAYEQQIGYLSLVHLDNAKQVPPTKGEQSATTTFLQGFCQGRHRNTDTHHLVLRLTPIFDTGNEIVVEEAHIRVDQLVDLFLREFRITIQVLIGGIDEFEYFLSIPTPKDILLGKLAHMQIVSFLYHGCYLEWYQEQ